MTCSAIFCYDPRREARVQVPEACFATPANLRNGGVRGEAELV